MHRKTVLVALVGCLAFWWAMSSPAAAAPAPQKIAQFKFSGTLSDADQKYLGLEKPGPFTLKDIKAPYVLIEIMRTTCPHCVAQVPALNQLYQLVTNSKLKDKVKIISVGESDQVADLKNFRAAHKIPYPLVSDPDWEFCSECKITGTPTTLLVDQSGKVLLVEDGPFASAGQVLKKIKAKLK
jgi:peroxiredoxin